MWWPQDGGTISAQDINQVISTINGSQLTNPGPMFNISTQVVTTTVATVTFSSVPAWRHIFLTWQTRCTNNSNNGNLYAQLNGNSTNNYYSQGLYTNAATAVADTHLAQPKFYLADVPAALNQSIISGSGWALFSNWSSTTFDMQFVSNGFCPLDNASNRSFIRSGAYNVGTGPYTSLTLTTDGNFDGTQSGGSIFTLSGSM